MSVSKQKGSEMTIIHKTSEELRAMIDNLVMELQDWREYEEEVDCDDEASDVLTDAIDSLLAVVRFYS
jgi:hypothetical protein